MRPWDWDTETHRRNLIGQIHRLDNVKLALIDGAFEINILDLLAEVGLGVDKANQTVFDREVDVSALLNFLGDIAAGLDNKTLAAVSKPSVNSWSRQTIQ